MKKIAIVFFVLVFAFSFTQAQTYKVDAEKSTINWLAKKVTGQHEGTVKLKSGELLFAKKTFKGGSFVINMQSIVCTDLKDEETNAKLIGHLKSDDFFSVDKFTDATLVITKVVPKGKVDYQIKGKLTIKGITNDIEFPATVSLSNGKVVGSAKISVDRTKYNVRYGSSKFFDSLGDKTINDVFEIFVKLEASK